jgi:hypothetical protein
MFYPGREREGKCNREEFAACGFAACEAASG